MNSTQLFIIELFKVGLVPIALAFFAWQQVRIRAKMTDLQEKAQVHAEQQTIVAAKVEENLTTLKKVEQQTNGVQADLIARANKAEGKLEVLQQAGTPPTTATNPGIANDTITQQTKGL